MSGPPSAGRSEVRLGSRRTTPGSTVCALLRLPRRHISLPHSPPLYHSPVAEDAPLLASSDKLPPSNNLRAGCKLVLFFFSSSFISVCCCVECEASFQSSTLGCFQAAFSTSIIYQPIYCNFALKYANNCKVKQQSGPVRPADGKKTLRTIHLCRV